MEEIAECFVGEQFLNLILLQVIPGKELEVTAAVKKIRPEAVVCYGFGKYDLIVISFDDKFSLANELRKAELPFVLAVDVFCGYRWSLTETSRVNLDPRAPFIGVCCLKLNWAAIEGSAIKEEQKIAKMLMESAFVPLDVYGGLGDPELICVVGCSDLDSLATAIMTIRQVYSDSEKSPFLDITTIPTINVLKESIDKTGDGNIGALLLLSLNGGSLESIVQKLASEGATEISPIFGFHDIMARFDLPPRKLMQVLSELRKSNVDYSVYSSNTIIRHDGLLGAETGQVTWGGRTTNRQIRGFLENYPQVAEDFGYYYHLYQTTKIDPLRANMFRNLDPFFIRLSEIYIDAQKLLSSRKVEDLEDYQDNMDDYDTVIDCLRLAIQQRYSGLYIGNLLGAKSFNIEAFGGSKKLLMAHEAIPLSLIEAFGCEWSGFSVFGYVHKFYRSSCGIINMPNETKMHPEKWWGTYHEVGHEAFEMLKQLDEKRYAQLDKLARNYDDLLYGLVYETFADMFDLHFGFSGDWTFYIQTIWGYLAEHFPLTEFYLARLLLVYYSLGPGKSFAFKENPLRAASDFEAMVNKLEEIGKVVKDNYCISGEIMSRASDLFWAVLDSARHLSGYFEGKSIASKTSFDEITTKFRKGICLRIANPKDVINSMLYQKTDIDLRQRVLAVLSLYDFASQRYYSH